WSSDVCSSDLFHAAVPAAVVILAVAVIVEVRLVVLFVVAHEVAQREAVVRRDEVDARVRTTSAVFVQIARSRHAIGELPDQTALSFPIVPNDIAVLPVPFGPADGKAADLIAALAQVPGL